MSVSKLREAINSGETLLAPGVYDMVSAAIAEKIGIFCTFCRWLWYFCFSFRVAGCWDNDFY